MSDYRLYEFTDLNTGEKVAVNVLAVEYFMPYKGSIGTAKANGTIIGLRSGYQVIIKESYEIFAKKFIWG